jgi:hypothetical protein
MMITKPLFPKAKKLLGHFKGQFVQICESKIRIEPNSASGPHIKISTARATEYAKAAEAAKQVIEDFKLPLVLDDTQKRSFLLFLRFSDTPETEAFLTEYKTLRQVKAGVAKKSATETKKEKPAKKAKKKAVKKSPKKPKRAYTRRTPVLSNNVQAIGMLFQTLSPEEQATLIKTIGLDSTDSFTEKVLAFMKKNGYVLVSKSDPFLQKGTGFFLNIIDLKK